MNPSDRSAPEDERVRVSTEPAQNPRYAGRTPEEVMRMVFRPMSDAELRELKARCRRKG